MNERFRKLVTKFEFDKLPERIVWKWRWKSSIKGVWIKLKWLKNKIKWMICPPKLAHVILFANGRFIVFEFRTAYCVPTDQWTTQWEMSKKRKQVIQRIHNKHTAVSFVPIYFCRRTYPWTWSNKKLTYFSTSSRSSRKHVVESQSNFSELYCDSKYQVSDNDW